ncbi:MBL fold hydrolase [candidate division KSB3 bacterium]|nr:MAG: MBL fold hydrolase [candidate division KSB3 bacterium]
MEYDQGISELADGVYWLGPRTESRLEVNVYLRVFRGKNKTTNMLIDPGPPVLFDEINERVREVIGSQGKIQMAYINHQDPDVATNTVYFQKRNPRMTVISTEDTWRLTHFFGLRLSNFQSVDRFKRLRARLSTGAIVRFIPTPFCHFRGACMLYDETSRILFSGDLFGGLSFDQGLYATKDNWEGIRIFHQIYMPSQNAIRAAVDKIRSLKPAPLMIAPQHGSVIKGELIQLFLERMYDLPVGLDLLKPTLIDKEIYLQAINELLLSISERVNPEIVQETLQRFKAADGSFPNLFTIQGKTIVDFKEDNVLGSFKILLEELMKNQPTPVRDLIKDIAATSSWDLPIFHGSDEEGAIAPEFLLDDDIVEGSTTVE